MISQRIIRVNELLRREIGGALFHVLERGGHDVDLSRLTVTRVWTAPDLRRARVFVSVRDPEQGAEALMSELRRHRRDLQEWIHRHLDLRYTPRLSFELDRSLAQGDRILGILDELEKEQTGPGPRSPAGEEEAP